MSMFCEDTKVMLHLSDHFVCCIHWTIFYSNVLWTNISNASFIKPFCSTCQHFVNLQWQCFFGEAILFIMSTIYEKTIAMLHLLKNFVHYINILRTCTGNASFRRFFCSLCLHLLNMQQQCFIHLTILLIMSTFCKHTIAMLHSSDQFVHFVHILRTNNGTASFIKPCCWICQHFVNKQQ